MAEQSGGSESDSWTCPECGHYIPCKLPALPVCPKCQTKKINKKIHRCLNCSIELVDGAYATEHAKVCSPDFPYKGGNTSIDASTPTDPSSRTILSSSSQEEYNTANTQTADVSAIMPPDSDPTLTSGKHLHVHPQGGGDKNSHGRGESAVSDPKSNPQSRQQQHAHKSGDDGPDKEPVSSPPGAVAHTDQVKDSKSSPKSEDSALTSTPMEDGQIKTPTQEQSGNEQMATLVTGRNEEEFFDALETVTVPHLAQKPVFGTTKPEPIKQPEKYASEQGERSGKKFHEEMVRNLTEKGKKSSVSRGTDTNDHPLAVHDQTGTEDTNGGGDNDKTGQKSGNDKTSGKARTGGRDDNADGGRAAALSSNGKKKVFLEQKCLHTCVCVPCRHYV